jgi:hypothetical protein
VTLATCTNSMLDKLADVGIFLVASSTCRQMISESWLAVFTKLAMASKLPRGCAPARNDLDLMIATSHAPCPAPRMSKLAKISCLGSLSARLTNGRASSSGICARLSSTLTTHRDTKSQNSLECIAGTYTPGIR